MKLIVGLGNPGAEYKHTRHNVGFMVIDALVRTWGCATCSTNKAFKSELTEARLDDEKILIAKPTTFMNNSGEAVAAIRQFYKIDPEDIWVIYDDKDIDLGRMKIAVGGGSAGHNGIKSLIEVLGTDAFVRFRIGIKNPESQGKMDTADFVLGTFGEMELPLINESIKRGCASIQKALEKDIPSAQNEFNT